MGILSFLFGSHKNNGEEEEEEELPEDLNAVQHLANGDFTIEDLRKIKRSRDERQQQLEGEGNSSAPDNVSSNRDDNSTPDNQPVSNHKKQEPAEITLVGPFGMRGYIGHHQEQEEPVPENKPIPGRQPPMKQDGITKYLPPSKRSLERQTRLAERRNIRISNRHNKVTPARGRLPH